MKYKLIYVAGPFRGPDHWAIHQNIARAEAVAHAVWSTPGCAAICPHLNTEHYQGSLPDEVWLDGDLEILSRCDAVVLVSGWERSKGTLAEVEYAVDRKIPVFNSVESLHDWLRNLGK